MKLTYRPIQRWPGAFTKYRKPSPFRTEWGETLLLLEREIDELGANAWRVLNPKGAA